MIFKRLPFIDHNGKFNTPKPDKNTKIQAIKPKLTFAKIRFIFNLLNEIFLKSSINGEKTSFRRSFCLNNSKISHSSVQKVQNALFAFFFPPTPLFYPKTEVRRPIFHPWRAQQGKKWIIFRNYISNFGHKMSKGSINWQICPFIQPLGKSNPKTTIHKRMVYFET